MLRNGQSACSLGRLRRAVELSDEAIRRARRRFPHGRSSPRKAHAKPAHVTPSEAWYAVELARSADMLRQRELAAQHARAERSPGTRPKGHGDSDEKTKRAAMIRDTAEASMMMVQDPVTFGSMAATAVGGALSASGTLAGGSYAAQAGQMQNRGQLSGRALTRTPARQ